MSLNTNYAPYTENELGHELIQTFVLADDGLLEATFELNEQCGQDVELTITFAGQSHTAQAPSFFEALNGIREILEKDNIYPVCYGTCENVYPSAMSLSMGTGRLAYRCALGSPARNEDIVDIFNTDEACVPVTIEAQKLFNRTWVESTVKRTAQQVAGTPAKKKSLSGKMGKLFG